MCACACGLENGVLASFIAIEFPSMMAFCDVYASICTNKPSKVIVYDRSARGSEWAELDTVGAHSSKLGEQKNRAIYK